MTRALKEFRIRGVKTNIPYLLNVLENKEFVNSAVDTSFIDMNPKLFEFKTTQNRGQKLLNYLAEVMVNGPTTELGTNLKPSNIQPQIPQVTTKLDKDFKIVKPKGWRDVFVNEGASSFAKSIRDHTKSSKALLLTDTTMRGIFGN